MRGIGALAECRDIGAGLLEFGFGQLHVAREVMQMAHESRRDLAQARVAGAAHRLEHGVGHLLLIFDDHARLRNGA